MNHRYISAALVSLMCSVSGAHAQQANPGETGELPQANTRNGITYVCGGVGSDEAERMKRAARKYDLMVTFATRQGDYLSDVEVDIADTRGRSLLNTTCDGPIMLVDVPKGGRYHIRGKFDGRSTSGTALLGRGAKGKPLHLVVPAGQRQSG